jgi:hypothetical protein
LNSFSDASEEYNCSFGEVYDTFLQSCIKGLIGVAPKLPKEYNYNYNYDYDFSEYSLNIFEK